jgi:hypothetical protein
MFGWGYVKDFCISLFQKKQEEKVEKYYIAECLRMLTENTAKAFGGGYMEIKMHDILNPKPVDERTANDVIGDIKAKLEKMK